MNSHGTGDKLKAYENFLTCGSEFRKFRNGANKEELFLFLSNKLELVDLEDGKEIFSTSGTAVLAKGNTHSMLTCNHEEADTRMLIHMLDTNDATTGLVHTVDTDVIVIFVGLLNQKLLVNPACYMGSIWEWKELPVHTHQWYM